MLSEKEDLLHLQKVSRSARVDNLGRNILLLLNFLHIKRPSANKRSYYRGYVLYI